MNKTLIMMALCAVAFAAKAQDAPVPVYQEYGKISQEDLDLKQCDFEKDANAEVLIDKGSVYFDQNFNLDLDCHKRIKIFNDHGKDAANIRIEYFSIDKEEYISGLQAQTINIVDGKPQITKIDKKQIFTQVVDKYRSAIVFTMPDVKAGSIIEYKYVKVSKDYHIPTWYFQDKIPVRYDELDVAIPEYFYFSPHMNNIAPFQRNERSSGNNTLMLEGGGTLPYTTNDEKRVMVNVPSINEENYMRSYEDNLIHISFVLQSFRPPQGFVENYNDTWGKIGDILLTDEDFGVQCKRKLDNEEALITKAAAFKTDDEKIAFLFNEVKNDMKWNEYDDWYTNDGTVKAWQTKTGNATEINLILYHLLKKAGVNARPMVVSTREHGIVNPAFPYLRQFNRGIVYVPVDSTKSYFLDASDKYNLYNEIPYNILNSEALYVDMDNKAYDMVFVQKKSFVRNSVFVNAEISADGKMTGTAQVSSESYFKIDNTEAYKKDGEQKYTDNLKDGDNNLKIASLKVENLDVDTLPLIQKIDFNLDLTGSGDGYIYFSPNLFTKLKNNPFVSEKRTTDIDMGGCDNITLSGIYKIPAGYAINALPQNINMITPDKGVSFRRIIGQQDGSIAVRYVVTYNKSIFFKENYADLHEFFKKMYEMLNEPVVLKKS
jgi:hypothetical protein